MRLSKAERGTALDLAVINATILTLGHDRRVIAGGSVAVADGRITAVGDAASVHPEGAGQVIDAKGKVLMPGFVNAHTHAIHNLLRGGLSDDRVLYDWLLNVLYPGVLAYTAEDARIAARLFCLEAIRSGITTVVDNADFGKMDYLADATIDVYREMGLRAIYARMFSDHTPPELIPYLEAIEAKEPEVHHDPSPTEDTAAALDSISRLIERHHGAADGRIQVWPSPGIAVFTTREGLLGAKDLARRNGTMLTIHVAESRFDAQQNGVSGVEYLASIGFLGPDVLAGHCVQLDHNDIRMLRVTDTRVANNVVSNMFLASGIAPVAEMVLAGVTVGIGTDDCNCNTSVSMLSDMKFAALAQKVKYGNSAAITAEKVVEMATIDGARAVGLGDEIGSIEVGKKADFILLDLNQPQTVPAFSIPSVLVYQTYGNEVDTVVVDGNVLMEGRRLTHMSADEESELLTAAQSAAEAVVERAGMARIRDRGWKSFVGV
ncbi:MAG: 5-methylthioadenosine/S-adenosylhomocysteine deaminase [Chloroflexota bacterium]|jgi:atrazine chlorohydrolase/5-methylthioadenosine/S-adenosylhomocysteine deaminase/melamine deaminase|nr:5-methylthioadenosine/S-adenosylhomocysteine deaminase [Chloroflexota bacterium]